MAVGGKKRRVEKIGREVTVPVSDRAGGRGPGCGPAGAPGGRQG